MTRRFETGSCPASPRRSVRHRARRPAGIVGAALVLLGAAACQGEPAPRVEGEPARAPATSSAAAPPAAAAPSSAAAPSTKASAQVGLAKYEESSAAGAAAASANAAAPASGSHASNDRVAAADAPAKAPGGQTVQGTVVQEAPFSVWLQADTPLIAGKPATVEAVLVANPPYHCNADYPHKFKLGAAPAGISYPEPTVKGAKITPERSVLAIPVQARAPGKATVTGTLQFSVCNDERCLVEKRELALNLDVK
jgi:hypothetical protein